MKKLLLNIIFLLILLVQTVNAADIDNLLPRVGEDGQKNAEKITEQFPDAANVANLPKVGAEDLIASAITTILKLGGILTTIALVVAGIFYMMARGTEDDLKKSKDIIVYLIIGMAIMGSAYAIVTGILKIKVF